MGFTCFGVFIGLPQNFMRQLQIVSHFIPKEIEAHKLGNLANITQKPPN